MGICQIKWCPCILSRSSFVAKYQGALYFTYLNLWVLSSTMPATTEPTMPASTIISPMRPASSPPSCKWHVVTRVYILDRYMLMCLTDVLVCLLDVLVWFRDVSVCLIDVLVWFRDVLLWFRDVLMWFRDVSVCLIDVLVWFKDVSLFLIDMLVCLEMCQCPL